MLLAANAIGQNLVVNGSFEEKSYCPVNFNQQYLNNISSWWQTGDGTPDYFHSCSDKAGVPANVFGNQKAQQGEAYAGLVTYSTGGKRNYREYLQTKLTRPLGVGEMVCIEMYISAADLTNYVTDGIGIALTKEKAKQEKDGVMKVEPALSNLRLHMLDEDAQWVLISDVFTAIGGEEYLTIGNFLFDKEMKIIRRTADFGTKGQGNWAYVYIDNVSVKPVKKKEECSCENDLLASLIVDPPLELSEYSKIKLDAILFDFDKDVITAEAAEQLDEVYALLRKNKAMYMEISGYTDIVGPDGYNMELSKRRAQSVINHLVQKGIAEDRLQLTYFGKQNPVADNESENGRAQNRRVEFQILEKKFELVQ
ncbi:MAG: OmpA family protein [Flavobacteriales bacterium]